MCRSPWLSCSSQRLVLARLLWLEVPSCFVIGVSPLQVGSLGLWGMGRGRVSMGAVRLRRSSCRAAAARAVNGAPVKYEILFHSNHHPWGHPTSDFVAEHQALPAEQREQLSREFEAVLSEMSERGELVGGEALADPATAKLYRWDSGRPLATDGPYPEAKEHLAGFFLIDVESRERAEELVARFAGPGETVELRPTMSGSGEDQ